MKDRVDSCRADVDFEDIISCMTSPIGETSLATRSVDFSYLDVLDCRLAFRGKVKCN
jgi:hypothetical protein